jgi:antimicrobial peptide system SdpA family protein
MINALLFIFKFYVLSIIFQMKIKIFYLATLLIFTFFIIRIFSYSIAYNLNVTSHKFSFVKNLLIPQGWGFFTRDIREDYMLNLYDLDDNKLLESNSSIKNYFGFSKKARKISMEVAIINARIPDSLWSDINNFNSDNQMFLVSNKYLYYLKNGKYKLTRHKITPYLWRNLPNKGKKELIYVETSDK